MNYWSFLRWIEHEKIIHVAVHLDVDAINPRRFRPVLSTIARPALISCRVYRAAV
jgi:hypothetical protein